MNLDMSRISSLPTGAFVLALAACSPVESVLPGQELAAADGVETVPVSATQLRPAGAHGHPITAAAAPIRSGHMRVGITITGDEPDHDP